MDKSSGLRLLCPLTSRKQQRHRSTVAAKSLERGLRLPEVYRADHLGSLLRPPELLKARADLNEGHITPGNLREIEDKAILDALEMQCQVGMRIFTDGEYRRGDSSSLRLWSYAVIGLPLAAEANQH